MPCTFAFAWTKTTETAEKAELRLLDWTVVAE
jgi:hypothetical protein